MANTQQQGTELRSGKELALIVGVLLMVAAGTIVTYWVSSRGTEASAKPDAVAAAETPAGVRVVAPAPTGLEALHADVFFDFKSTRLRADAVRVLQETALAKDRASAWAVLVQGFADRQGPPEYNRVLAQRRAEAVKQFLVELGVPEASVKVVTVGQEGSLCDEPSKECLQLNRRVHIEMWRLARAAAAPVRATIADGDALDPASPSPARP
jgi:outer membrane protein OmpA-like peptidoglycan-associated protein